MQIIINNASIYKQVSEISMAKRSHLYWTACVAYSLDLILHDFAKFKIVENILDDAK